MQTRSKYLKQLEGLEDSLTRLAEKAAADVRAAGRALSGDADAASAVLEGGEVERSLRGEIERACLDIMLLQQPLVAGDLRFVSGAFRAVSDIAHVDSMARDVAFLATNIPPAETEGLNDTFAALSERTATMVEDAFAAFLAASEDQAHSVYAMDDEVDGLYRQAEDIVVDRIRASAAGSDVACLPELLMAAKYFERIGDDAQRLAAWAVFRATGEHEVYSVQSKEGAEKTGE